MAQIVLTFYLDHMAVVTKISRIARTVQHCPHAHTPTRPRGPSGQAAPARLLPPRTLRLAQREPRHAGNGAARVGRRQRRGAQPRRLPAAASHRLSGGSGLLLWSGDAKPRPCSCGREAPTKFDRFGPSSCRCTSAFRRWKPCMWQRSQNEISRTQYYSTLSGGGAKAWESSRNVFLGRGGSIQRLTTTHTNIITYHNLPSLAPQSPTTHPILISESGGRPGARWRGVRAFSSERLRPSPAPPRQHHSDEPTTTISGGGASARRRGV